MDRRRYGASPIAGAVRTIARIEERWAVGGGRVWAGDAAFGVDSDTQLGGRFRLLAVLPPESQRLWHVDLALPVGRDRYAHWEIRMASTLTLDFRREPDDVARVRAGGAPSKIFTWW